MQNYYLAIDIGASSGRHILGYLKEGKLVTEEIHRFDNGIIDKDGVSCWDLEALFLEIKIGMKKCKDIGKIPSSVGIDTWAVDFVLLDKQDNIIGDTVAYRDERTKGMDEKVYSILSEEQLYQATGIQKLIFNTIYQLKAVKDSAPEHLLQAEKLLLVPDYFHYLLSGEGCCEYTNATTTQLVNPTTKDWDWDLIQQLGYPKKIFSKIVQPGSCLGNLTQELQKEVGYSCKVVAPATHDTGSAVMSVPSTSDNPLYISSGTWSLLGTEKTKADCSEESRKLNFTNEGGYDYRFRYLKNIMGLWMIQSVKKEIGKELSFAQICEKASKSQIASLVDCNDNRFLAPSSMTKEVQKACEETNQPIPEGIGEVAAVIYNSLAVCYKNAVDELEKITKNTYDTIHVVGGGSNADYLNELTARYTGKTVIAGPGEATAIGNILAQMIASQELKDLQAARICVINSINTKKY